MKKLEIEFPDGNIYEVIVAEIDKSIGITVLYDNGNGTPAMCLNGPSSPHYNEYCKIYSLYEEKYEEMFDLMTKQIKEKKITIKLFYDMLNSTHNPYGTTQCAYS